MTAIVNVWNLIHSMRSVNRWEESIQGNINGAVRNAYKESEIYFGGNSTGSTRAPSGNAAGIQVGEQTVSVSHNEIHWGQGDLIQTKQDYDFGIQGSGFFMLTENAPSAPTVPAQKIFFTRDGQFHQEFDSIANKIRYRANNGMYVVSRDDAVLMGLPGVTATPVGTSLTSQAFFALAKPDTLENLTFSKFGSTIYENIVGTNTYGLADINDFGKIENAYLEGSNVNLDKQIASLNANKSFQDVLTKQLLVYYSNLDVGLNLIK